MVTLQSETPQQRADRLLVRDQAFRANLRPQPIRRPTERRAA
jgi:hypothetical protein